MSSDNKNNSLAISFNKDINLGNIIKVLYNFCIKSKYISIIRQKQLLLLTCKF